MYSLCVLLNRSVNGEIELRTQLIIHVQNDCAEVDLLTFVKILGKCLITAHKRSCRWVMFFHMSVILSGGGLMMSLPVRSHVASRGYDITSCLAFFSFQGGHGPGGYGIP